MEGWKLMNVCWQSGGILTGLCLMESVCCVGLAAPINDVGGELATLNEAGQASIRQRDYVAAERYFRQAREKAELMGRMDFVEEMDARRAAMYINDGEPSRAVFILQPYIKQGVNKFILSDFLMALRAANQPQEVIKVFHEHVNNWQEFPVYGLQIVGDVYLRQGKYKEACTVYEHILSREKVEDVPYVQLGYAYALVHRGKNKEAVAAYAKTANLAPRYNNIIVGDAEAFIAEGRVGLARRMFALLGKDDREKEAYQLQYAQCLVNVGKEYENESQNFRRDEYMTNRSYYHEASNILGRLAQSQDEEIAHEAQVTQAANDIHNDLLAGSHKRLQEMLDEDSDDMLALASMGEYEQVQLHSLTTAYENSVDDKGNREQSLSLSFESYLGQDFYGTIESSRNWLQDDDRRKAYWENSLGLRKKFSWGEIGGEWIRYDGTHAKNGYSLFTEFEFSDVTKLTFAFGRRLHEHVGTVEAGIRENYRQVTLNHNLTRKTSLNGHYLWADLTDGNKYTEYGININHLLQVKHNYSDRLLASYSHGKYDQEVWLYDSPWRRDDYSVGFSRKWNLPQRSESWQWLMNLSWGRDNDERMGFAPNMRLEYVKDLPHNQQLKVGATLYKYFRQPEVDRRRSTGYLVDVSYNWGW